MRYACLLGLLLLTSCGNYPTCDVSKLVKGISSKEVIALCGSPNIRNHTGAHEQWVYRTWGLTSQYIYIENGLFSNAQWSD